MPTAALAFSSLGTTVTFTAAGTAPTAVQAPSSAPVTRPAYQYRVVNAGDNTVLLGVGASAGGAEAAAVSVAAGAIPLLSGAVEILSFPAGSYFSGTTAASTSVVYITPGEGI